MRGPRRILLLRVGLVAGSLLAAFACTVVIPSRYVARWNIQLDSMPGLSAADVEYVHRRLRNPSLMEEAAQKLGVRATAREIERFHLGGMASEAKLDGGIAVVIRPTREEWARRWLTLWVEEYRAFEARAALTIQAAPTEPNGVPRTAPIEQLVRVEMRLDELAKLRALLRKSGPGIVEKLSRALSFQEAQEEQSDVPREPTPQRKRFQIVARQRAALQARIETNTGRKADEARVANEELARIDHTLEIELASAASRLTELHAELVEEHQRLEPGRVRSIPKLNGTDARSPESSTAGRSIADAQIVGIQSPARHRDLLILGYGLVLGSVLAWTIPAFVRRRSLRWEGGDTLASLLKLQPLGITFRASIEKAPLSEEATAAIADKLPSDLPRIISVIGATGGGGKEFVLANLALACAANGERVVAVDADLEEAALLRVFGFKERTGLRECLAGIATLDQALQPSSFPYVTILGAGRPGASIDLNAEKLWEILEELRPRFDTILVGLPSLSEHSHQGLRAEQRRDVIFVVEPQRATLKQVKAAAKALRRGASNIIGFVTVIPTDETRSPTVEV